MQPRAPTRYVSLRAGDRIVAAAIASAPRVYRYLPFVASALLSGVVIYELAAIGLALRAMSVPIAMPASASKPDGVPLSELPSTSGIAAAHLFGVEAPTETAAEIELASAPDTTLNLRMSGILFGEGEASSQIIVADGERQRTHATGDRIDGSAATVRAIYSDRAVIEREGRLETLRLPKDFGDGASSAVLPVLQIATESVPQADSPPPSYAAVVVQPLKDIIGVAPRRNPEGDGASFTLNPGRHWKAATAAGFKAGALVVDVNGIALGDDPESGLQRFREALGSATVASITVRNSDTTLETITLDSSQLLRP